MGPQDLSGRGEEATHLLIWRLTFHISWVFIFFLRLKASDKLPVCFQHIDNYSAIRSTVCRLLVVARMLIFPSLWYLAA